MRNGGETLKYINHALQMGFAPINHDLRNSDTTISWYRGPLVPMSYAKSMSYTDISCADAALRYTPETGMFDASYAAAWQLGRLLALQDQAFAQALFRFRTDYQRWVRITNTEALQNEAQRWAEGVDTEALKARERESNNTAGQPRRQTEQHPRLVRASCSPTPDYLRPQRQPRPSTEHARRPPIPATVQNWLGQAMLLYGVPFQYLVPDEEMLPAESIRFFYLNPEWLNCLLQGACSVGRTSQTDELADQLLRARFFDVSEKLAKELRSYAQAKAKSRRGDGAAPPDIYGDDANVDENKAPALHWPLSGYLLRSAAVESWIGLEAKATGVDSTGNALDPLQILRMDRLAPDILLCIYNGKVTEIEVKQPPEAIHFGAASKQQGGGHEKTGLRKIKGDALGDKITVSVDVPMSKQRVVQVSDLAANIKKGLIDNSQMTSSDSFTSAEFAVEMIESPAESDVHGASMSDYLLVPTNVQAFLVGKPAERRRSGVRSCARAPNRRMTLRIGTATASIRFLSKASKLGSALEPGVHLHWALPDALMHARHEGSKEPEQPCIPNRWLVLRMWHAEGNSKISSKAWVVESDYVSRRRSNPGERLSSSCQSVR